MGRVKVSYVKKPFARRSIISFGLSLCALILFIMGISCGVNSNGQMPLNMAAVCFCSLLVALFSLAYGVFSFFEREKKYILAKLGLGVSGCLVIVWLILIIIGLRG